MSVIHYTTQKDQESVRQKRKEWMKKRFPGSFDCDSPRTSDRDNSGVLLSEKELTRRGVASRQSPRLSIQEEASEENGDKESGSSIESKVYHCIFVCLFLAGF